MQAGCVYRIAYARAHRNSGAGLGLAGRWKPVGRRTHPPIPIKEHAMTTPPSLTRAERLLLAAAALRGALAGAARAIITWLLEQDIH